MVRGGQRVAKTNKQRSAAMAKGWTAAEMPRVEGKRIVVTGANSGIGYDAAVELARSGAEVVLACRNTKKGDEALAALVKAVGGDVAGRVRVMALDLSSLASVRAFAAALRGVWSDGFDVLINNAGVMALPLSRTEDGFEMQIGTNHLGHFALTGLVLDLIRPGGRVVNVSSMAHQMGTIRLDDLSWEKTYSRLGAYAQSKLANLLFTFELERKLKAAGKQVSSVACHPGYSATNLGTAPVSGIPFGNAMKEIANKLMAQPSEMGALPTLYAAVMPDVAGGDYIGPDGFREIKGYPTKVKARSTAHDAAVAAKLWALSEQLTKVSYAI